LHFSAFAIVALNANVYRLKDSHCQFQSYLVVIVTFLGMFVKPWRATVSFFMSFHPSICLSTWNN